jgi:hypothetical protein
MNPFRSLPRRRRKTVFGPELLETRELLTGGSNTFAIIPGSVTTTNGTAAIKFTVDPGHFTLPRHALTLGIDVVADSGSTIKPFISEVDDSSGTIIPQTFHSIYNPHLSHFAVASGQGSSAVLSPLSFGPKQLTQPTTFTVIVSALGKTSGNFLLGFYLPGDANGDGVVNKTDLQIVKSLQNTRSTSSKYNFNADVNRDGRIGKIDLAFTKQNQGVSESITPIVQANYDSSQDISTLSPRTTNLSTAKFTGTATPGSTITYTPLTANPAPATTTGSVAPAAQAAGVGQAMTTTTDSTGNYSITVPLAEGSNTFQVSSTDAFGQTITGTISPVNYVKPA